MSLRIVQAREVEWSPGKGNPSLSSVMNTVIDEQILHGLFCVGVERVTEFRWLMLFAQNTTGRPRP